MGMCAVLHLVAVAGAAPGSDAHILVMVAMALVCLPCATHLVLAPTRRIWVHAGVLAAGMLVTHWLLAAATGHVGHRHPGSAWSAVAGIGVVLGPAVTGCLAVAGVLVQRRVPGSAHALSARRGMGAVG